MKFGVVAALLVLVSCSSPSAEYIGSGSCASCHESQSTLWQQSDHFRAMEIPSEQTVEAPFSGEIFEGADGSYTFFQDHDGYKVVTVTDTFRVAYTFGHDPLQQYLLPTHRGRLQALTVVWNSAEGNWYSLYPGEAISSDDPLHWTSDNLNWNYMCADCHSTGVRRNYDLETQSYSTDWEELTVGCEACHGPASTHVDWALDSGLPDGDPFKSSSHLTVDGMNGRPDQSKLESELNTCASCHSRRVPLVANTIHGEAFLDQFAPSLLDNGLYYADGQILDEVYVYGSFQQSRMAQVGITCSDCHDPHSGQRKFEGNALCTSCHTPQSYDTAAHDLHQAGSEGAQCESCHMPATTYMGIDARRDHRFGSPNPTMSGMLDSPDACTGCHNDQTTEWAASFIEPVSTTESDPFLHLLQRASNDDIAPISRGSALAALSDFPDIQSIQLATLALSASSPFERVGALRAFAGWAPGVPLPNMERLYGDSLRWVRTEAVATALAAGVQTFDSNEGKLALSDYKAAQNAVPERAEPHVNLAQYFERVGEPLSAEQEWDVALVLDSTNAQLWVGKALFYTRGPQADRAKAERAFVRSARLGGDELSETLFLFGLFLSEDRTRWLDAARVLGQSSDLDADHDRKAYNAGLAFQQAGDATTAALYLERASALGLLEADNALVILYIQTEQWERAMEENDDLLERYPDRTEWLEREAFIKSNLD